MTAPAPARPPDAGRADEAWDCVVIGAGMSGLAAAIRLARLGQRVCVLERHYLWGGLNSFYKRAGRRIDTGLHALTNFVPKGTRGAPLLRILRQLRVPYDALALEEQRGSELRLPGLSLRFTNDPDVFAAEVARAFPAERAGFARLVADVRAYEHGLDPDPLRGARAELGHYLDDPLLIEALLMPTCYYGSAREGDVDWYQFVLLFRAILLEGLARPAGGIKALLDLLLERLRAEGATLRTRAGVKRVLVEDGAARGVELDDGAVLRAPLVLSSAGRVETARLCDAPLDEAPEAAAADPEDEAGRITFVETLVVTDRPMHALGHELTTLFWSDAVPLSYREPDGLVDTSTGVICTPDNYGPPRAGEGMLRVTVPASHARWAALAPEEYAAAKAEASERILDAAARLVPDPRPRAVWRDTFTPCTIARFTGHANGAIYGSPRKELSGRTAVKGLELIGTDQGLLGIVGALWSGLTIAARAAAVSAS